MLWRFCQHVFIIVMTTVFALQLHALLTEPEFLSFEPTIKLEKSFNIDKMESMIALKLRARNATNGNKELKQEEVDKDVRVSFKFSNGT